MSLTLSNGPLSSHRPSEVNYRIDGPKRLLLFEEFPRRVRAEPGGEVVADTRHGRLLHESSLLPVLYVPDVDLAPNLLEQAEHTTHCPFKGDAAYWSVRAGDRFAENAVWAYPDPIDDASWLRGFKAIEWGAMERWYDEDEEVQGHLRDPYHRVDVRLTTRPVRVVAGGEVLAESTRAKVLSETGLPNRYYLPREDVGADLEISDTTSVCPYKGTSTYWSTSSLEDVAWSYEEPLEAAMRTAGHVTFLHEDVAVELG